MTSQGETLASWLLVSPVVLALVLLGVDPEVAVSFAGMATAIVSAAAVSLARTPS